ncbi:hypothetical protein ACEN8I_07375 [Polaromonas sp. CT11-55]|uniref:hypothetical protein n=1 Tax=Polaromonas sp. CT11-55 TaxID=3243045 RepID=UPI0039A4DB00
MAAATSLDKLSARIHALAITRHYRQRASRSARPNTLRFKRARAFFSTQRFDLKAHARCRRQLPASGNAPALQAQVPIELRRDLRHAVHGHKARMARAAPPGIAHPGKGWFPINAQAL